MWINKKFIYFSGNQQSIISFIKKLKKKKTYIHTLFKVQYYKNKNTEISQKGSLKRWTLYELTS